jgi:hypothetical protein
MIRDRIEAVAGSLFFVGAIAAHILLGITAAVRVAGIACLFCGAIWAVGRSVPVGIEGRPPTFYVRGIGALVLGAIIAGLGVCLLVFAPQAACMLGWAKELECP